MSLEKVHMLGILSVKKTRRKGEVDIKWLFASPDPLSNLPHLVLCPRNLTSMSNLDRLPCPLASDGGRQWEELAFCRWEKNKFGCLFPWLPSFRGILVSVSMQLPSLSFSNHSPPMPLQNARLATTSRYCQLWGTILSLIGPKSCLLLCKVLGTATIRLFSLSVPLFLVNTLPDMYRFIDRCTVLPRRFL